MKIRNMQDKDAKAVSPLIKMAIEDLANVFTQSSQEEEIGTRLESLITTNQTRFSSQFGLVCEENENILGAGFAYMGGQMQELTRRSIIHIESLGIKVDPKDKSDLLASEEANEDEFYIDNLAVIEEKRGLGIGTLLLDAFEDLARANGRTKISILADTNNPKAKALYLSRGYVETGIRKVLHHSYYHLLKTL